MNKGALTAIGIGVGFLVLAGGGSKRASVPPRAPDPVLPPDWVPPENPLPVPAPRPRAPEREVTFESLHRYEIEVDVAPVDGVSLRSFAAKALEFYGLTDPEFKRTETVTRDGRQVQRVRLHANAISRRTVELNRYYAIAGAGAVWIVSVKDVTKF